MRKSLAVLTVCTFLLSACGVQGSETKPKDSKEEVKATKQVDIPSEYVGKDGKVDEWKSDEYTEVEIKDHETVYYMTDTQEKELRSTTQKSVETLLKEVPENPDYVAVKKIDQQNDFERLRLYVNKEKYEQVNQDALFRKIGLPIIQYQLLKGVKPEELVIECEIWDAQKDEVISVVNLPMDLSNGVLNQ